MTPADRGAAGVRPLWQGRAVALLAVVLVGLNLRTAVAALSPIYDRIGQDFAIGAIGIGFLGTLPPVSFAVVGLFAPALHRRFGVERVMVVAIVAILLGHLARASSGSYLVLVLASAVTFAGMGVANVLLPPLVKTYFPDRIGLLTALYATIMAMGATLPPLVAVPVADASSWRVSVGMWAVFAVLALVPLVTLLARRMRDRRDAADGAAPADAAGRPGPVDVPVERRKGFGRVLRSPVAWSLMLVFALTSVNAYAMFAWLPSILTDVAGASEAEAGALLSLFSVMGLPAALLVPILATRMKTVGPLIAAGVVFYLVGYGGLLLAPGRAALALGRVHRPRAAAVPAVARADQPAHAHPRGLGGAELLRAVDRLRHRRPRAARGRRAARHHGRLDGSAAVPGRHRPGADRQRYRGGPAAHARGRVVARPVAAR
jgi:CP family cyanate transporter-like MFS transporter